MTRSACFAIAATMLATPALAQQAPQGAAAPDAGDIVVTATKRETTLQTTSVAISVVGSEDIATRHLSGADDYLQSLPGVSYQDRGAGANTITIRGIGQGDQLSTNSPVGTYFGETPISGLGTAVNGNQAGNADLKLIDIKQVEVLRGPQGTLYGSGTMGGTVRVLPNAPNLHDVQGNIQGEYSNTARYGGSNYRFQGMFNLPIVEDKIAVRGVAYRFFDDGYLKNVAGSRPTPNLLASKALVPGLALRDQDHVGSTTSTGFRGAALFKPTEKLSLQVMYANQTDKNDGMVGSDIALGDYIQARAGTGAGGKDGEFVRNRIQLTNAVLSYDLGFGTLLNSTSFISTRGQSAIELDFYSPELFAGEDAENQSRKNVFVNEARFASNFKGPFQVLGGVYYENRRENTHQMLTYQYPTPIPATNLTEDYVQHFSQKQLAFFGEASLKLFNDKLTLTAGGRHFKYTIGVPVEVDNVGLPILPTGPVAPTANQGRVAKISGNTWKGNISYEFSRNLFVYGLFSEGFRAPILQAPIDYAAYDPDGNGLLNFIDGVQRKVPEGLLAPDSTKNYEIGVKFRGLNGKLRGSLTAYRIDWTGIPIVPSLTVNGGAAYYINAGKARSQGVEFESTLRLPYAFDLSGSFSYTDAVLSETQEGLGVKGTRLPGSAKWNAHAALQKNFKIVDHEGFARIDYTWVGKYYADLAQTPPAAGGYGLVDLSTGLTVKRLNFGIFAKNIFNSKAATWYDNVFTTRAYLLRPRTIGVRVGYTF